MSGAQRDLPATRASDAQPARSAEKLTGTAGGHEAMVDVDTGC